MTSPLYKALRLHIERDHERLYMPGHKGSLPHPLDGCAPYDVTELELTGCLYDGEGPPADTEERFSKLYQSGATLLSAGGSTLCIQAMLALFCRCGDRVIMSRNAHHAAVNACALLDLRPAWLFADSPSGVMTGGRISPEAVRKALEEHPDAAAVYITSPDYFGSLCDIGGISEVCGKFGKPLLVDNAHGAHLKFFDGLHPIEAGADCCCDSLHKTLPALTGGALLHLKDGSLKDEARRKMKLFGSTSPSYLIMLSCDMIIPRWQQLKREYRELAEQVSALAEKARGKGAWATDASPFNDPVRIPLLYPEGERGETERLLGSLKIEAEYISPRHIVLLPAPGAELERVRQLIDRLPPLDEKPQLFRLPPFERRLTPRQAVLGPSETLPVEKAVGRVAACCCMPCPPAVAVAAPGEVMTEEAVRILRQCGVKEISVTKD